MTKRKLPRNPEQDRATVPKKKPKVTQKQIPLQDHQVPFDEEDSILLIGEGNFSYAVSACKSHLLDASRLCATSFDNERDLLSKYDDVGPNLEFLRSSGAKVIHEIDARSLHKSNRHIKNHKWDRIIWNFPHSGSGIKDQDRAIRVNQELLLAFFKSAKMVLAVNGVIVVTLAETKPYDLWDLRGLAKSVGLSCTRSYKFNGATFPEYSHRRTIGYDEKFAASSWKGEERNARVYGFTMENSILFRPRKHNPDTP